MGWTHLCFVAGDVPILIDGMHICFTVLNPIICDFYDMNSYIPPRMADITSLSCEIANLYLSMHTCLIVCSRPRVYASYSSLEYTHRVS